MVDQLKKALPDMWRNSPPWFALMAVVVLFLVYLDRQETRTVAREQRAEMLSALRIDTCHAVQAEATEAIRNLTTVLQEQAITLERLKAVIEAKK